MTAKRQPSPVATIGEPWSHVITQPVRVVVFEDVARRGMLTLRWWNPEKNNWKRETLGKQLLRDNTGQPAENLTAWAIGEGMKRSLILAGQMPDLTKAGATAPLAQPLTIAGTWDVITHAETGKYRHDTPHRRDIKRALEYAALVWGGSRAWSALDDDAWIQLMRRRLDGLLKREKNGYRRTEITVARLASVAQFLRARKKIPSDAAHPPADWTSTLKDDWRRATNSRTDYEPARPRHTLEEMLKILAVSATGDPRFHMLLQLGAEYRLGQVVRCWRSDLDVEKGTLRVHGAGKKRGELIDFTPAQKKVAEAGLAGILATLEAARLRGDFADYPLFPAGRLRTTRQGETVLGRRTALDSPTKHPLKACSREWVMKQFRAIESAALGEKGHVQGRGAYGIRRVAVDAGLDEGLSTRGLMAAGGWSDSKIPMQVYAERDNKAGRKEAMRARAKIRGEQP